MPAASYFPQLCFVFFSRATDRSRLTGQVQPFAQGRGGYGPFSSPIGQQYRELQRRGAPQPILDVIEYFTLDAEDIRWGRWYRQAGLFTGYFVW